MLYFPYIPYFRELENEMEILVDMAKMTSKGQVTIPKAIRNILGLRQGDRVLFEAAPDGSVTIRNATLQAFDNAREAFSGASQEAGITSDEDVVEILREMRYGKENL